MPTWIMTARCITPSASTNLKAARSCASATTSPSRSRRRVGARGGSSASETVTARQRWTLAAVVLGSGIVFLDSTVVNVALPKIGDDLQSSLLGKFAAENFVYYGYLLSLSALLILAGALDDYYGRRRMFAL